MAGEPVAWVLERADALLVARRPEEALALVGAASAASPDSLPLCLALANVLLAGRNSKRALAEAERGIGLDPASAEPQLLRCRALQQLKKPRPAYRAARDARRLAPLDFRAPYLMGSCYLDMQMPKHAREHFAEARELAPVNADIWVALAASDLGAGRSRRAVEEAREALKIDPTNEFGLSVLARALAASGQEPDAVDIIHGLVRDSPRQGALGMATAQAFMDSGVAYLGAAIFLVLFPVYMVWQARAHDFAPDLWLTVSILVALFGGMWGAAAIFGVAGTRRVRAAGWSIRTAYWIQLRDRWRRGRSGP